ncbi:uncharacterized protein LOC130137352 [Syzygium oleosum]|uniref:uncharacterized protein LOC130137352 n=1 Tax=Syzygium oleosum TaxID=219896 RepID=UPI0024BACA1C|nr:uncharacterized protein LOC130137352 [Syzygium oleosum]
MHSGIKNLLQNAFHVHPDKLKLQLQLQLQRRLPHLFTVESVSTKAHILFLLFQKSLLPNNDSPAPSPAGPDLRRYLRPPAQEQPARRSRPPPSPPPARPRATRPRVPTSAVAFSRPREAGSRALIAVTSAAKPSSVLLPNGRGWGSGGGLFSVDFVDLCCKSKRARRRLGVSRSRGRPRLLSASKPAPPSSVKAVLHLEWAGHSSSPRGEPPRQFGDKLQGNLNRMQSCENSLKSPVWHGRENEIRPFGFTPHFEQISYKIRPVACLVMGFAYVWSLSQGG